MKSRFVVAVLLALCSTVVITGFDIPTHRAVTLEQLATITATVQGNDVKFSQRALQEVADANEATDNLSSAALFHPERHFTNEAFVATSTALRDLRTRVLEAVRADPPDGTQARQHLGRALHGIQDFYSHSNWVEQGAGGPLAGLGTTIFANPPAGLHACPASPNTLGPGGGGGTTSGYYLGILGCSTSSLPAGKCFHGNYTASCPGINKDKPEFTGHGAARGLAETATRNFVQEIVTTLNGEDEATMALLDVKGTTGFVIDDTGSMSGTIDGVKTIVGQIVNRLNSNPDLKPTNWLLERFGDPDIGPPFVTKNAGALLGAVSGLFAHGGGDCPELSQGGLLEAIDAALPTSNLMLFTDATAKDSGLANTVVARARAKRIRINYAIYGSCSPVDPAYLTGAAETGGYLFFMDQSETSQLFELFAAQLTGDLVRINALSSTVEASPVTTVPVDSSMTGLVVLVNTALGNAVTLRRPNGNAVVAGDFGVTFTTLSGGDTIITVDAPAPGGWTVEVGGSGAFSLIADGNSPLEFYRFDFVRANTDIHGGYFPIEGLPLANSTVLGQATLLGPATSATFTLVDENGAPLMPVSLAQNFPNAGEDRYLGSFVLPAVPFRVAVSGVDSAGFPYRRLTSALYRGQTVGLAVELPSVGAGTVEAGGTTTFDVTVRNVGAPDTFSLTAVSDNPDAGVFANPSIVTLATDATAVITLTVNAPAAVEPGSAIVITITGTSTTNTAITNSASLELAVIAPDTIAPELTLPADMTVPATSPAGAVVTYAALALDNVDGAVDVTCSPASGSLFARGTTTTVNCVASDSRSNTANGSFLVTVVNAPPVANADTAQSQGAAVQIAVLANDTDADGGTLAVTAVSTPANGTAVIGAGGSVAYTPAAGFSGTDTFTYTVSDGQGGTATGNVSVAVTPTTATPDGLMFGAGRLDEGGMHQHFLFIVFRDGNLKIGRLLYWTTRADRCDDDRDQDDGRRSESYDDNRWRNRRGPATVFAATSVTNIVFSNDPAFEPGAGATNDTVRFLGTGKLNGRSHTFEAVATDQGEPGRTRDTFSIAIKNSQGQVITTVNGSLTAGNVQSVGIR